MWFQLSNKVRYVLKDGIDKFDSVEELLLVLGSFTVHHQPLEMPFLERVTTNERRIDEEFRLTLFVCLAQSGTFIYLSVMRSLKFMYLNVWCGWSDLAVLVALEWFEFAAKQVCIETYCIMYDTYSI